MTTNMNLANKLSQTLSRENSLDSLYSRWTDTTMDSPEQKSPIKNAVLKWLGESASTSTNSDGNQLRDVVETASQLNPKDASLVNLFQQMKLKMDLPHSPLLKDANQVREWMLRQENKPFLHRIKQLILKIDSNVAIASERSYNFVTAIPEEIDLLTNVESLCIEASLTTDSYPTYVSIPTGMDLTRLKSLTLINTVLDALPTQMPNLESLDLTNSHINAPIKHMPRLKSLHMDDCETLSFSKDFNPPNLKELIVRNIPFISFPEGLKGHKLMRLILNNTEFTSLPGGLEPRALVTLDLENSRFSELPDDINLSELTELNLSGTNISSLGKPFNMPKLVWLYLRGSQFKEIPADSNLGSVVYLDIRDTEIRELPNCLDLTPRRVQLFPRHYEFSEFLLICNDAFWDNLDAQKKNIAIRHEPFQKAD